MTFSGVIKGISYETGWGFIECPQTQTTYGKDVFFMKKDLAGYFVRKGDPVTFSVGPSDKGPHASNIQVKTDSPVFLGEIKSFNPTKGWGMISCEATEKMYGKDIFLLKTACVDGYMASPGDPVQFSVEESQKGPQANNVKVLVKNRKAPDAGATVGGNLPPGQTQDLLQQLATIQKALGIAVTAPHAGAMVGASFQGVIKSYNSQKGWGMIECGSTKNVYGKDMFFLKTSLAADNATPGDQVQFTISQGLKGVQAADVRVMGNGGHGIRPSVRVTPY